MDDLFELIWHLWHGLYEWFFGNTGRLLIKAITLGQVDLDLDRWGQCFLAVVVGLIFWAAILAAFLWLKFPQLFSFLGQMA